MRKEPLKQWVWQHFSMSVDELIHAMNAKPLREFVAVFNWDNRCTCRCSHCFMVESEKEEARRSIDDVCALFAGNTSATQVRETYFYLQDPTARLTEFLRILTEFPQNYLEIDPSIFLSRPDLLKTFRDLGVKWIAHSLHGDYPAHHALTGQSKQHWVKLIEGFRAAVAFGFMVEITTCVYAENADRVESCAEVIDSIGGVDIWFVNRVVPVGRAKEWPLERCLYGEACGKVVRRLARCFGQMRTVRSCRLDVTWGPNYYGIQGKAMLGQREEIERGIYNCHTSSDVALGIRNFLISRYTGHVYPCVYAIGDPDLRIGEFNHGKIHLNWERTQNYLPERRLGKLSGWCAPEHCGFAPICVGCHSVAHAFASKIQPGVPVPSNVGLDFCLTRYIRDCHEHADAMADLASIISFPPISKTET